MFILVGMSTPVGVLAVNASAFVMRHLTEFRFGIAACALISGLSLTGVSFWAALNRAERHAPNLYAEYKNWAIGIAVIVVVGWSALGAWLTYKSMVDPRQLPNLAAVLTALYLLLLPFLMTFLSRRLRIFNQDREPAGPRTRRRLVRTPPEP